MASITRIPTNKFLPGPLKIFPIWSILAICKEMPHFSRPWRTLLGIFPADLSMPPPGDVLTTTFTTSITRIPLSNLFTSPFNPSLLPKMAILAIFAGTHTAGTPTPTMPILLPMEARMILNSIHTLMQ